MGRKVKELGDEKCSHKWVKRDKKNISILTRYCDNCGRVEDVSEALTDTELTNLNR